MQEGHRGAYELLQDAARKCSEAIGVPMRCCKMLQGNAVRPQGKAIGVPMSCCKMLQAPSRAKHGCPIKMQYKFNFYIPSSGT
eukprot:1034637-Pelagomonas_calceolata.AAC.2